MNDALRIAELPAGRNGGLIGVTFAPGKKQKHGWTGSHDRDLAVDLDVIAAWGAAAVVTLTTKDELRTLQIPTIGQEVRARFMEWLHLPILDYHTPDAHFEAAWPEASLRLRSLVEAGARVLIHCKGGMGRAGMIAARLLVEMGEDADPAIARTREVRSGAIETAEQADWVLKGSAQPLLPFRDPQAIRDRAIGALFGLAAGDALGTAIEFSAKPARVVLHELVGDGPFDLKPGQWTDDTSMALALADSLIADPQLDASDLMERFVRWRRDGDYSCTGRCFDIGNTVADALRRFERTGEPFAGSTDPQAAGNGSIMRLALVAIRHWRDAETRRRVARAQSRTTHGAAEAVEACATLSDLIALAIGGATLAELVTSEAARAVKGFALGQPRAEIKGSGYVVHSLHAALWAVSRTSNFRDAVLLAANLGQDADTTAAVAGQIAGALYGASAIPADWLEKLAWRERLRNAAEQLFDDGQGPEDGATILSCGSIGRALWKRTFQLGTPPIPDELKQIRLAGYRNIFELQGDPRYRLPDPARPNLWGTETLCGDWSGRLLIVLKDFSSTGWHRNQDDFGVPYYSHTPKSQTNRNLVKLLNQSGVELSFEGDGNTRCGALYASACFLLQDADDLSTVIRKPALEASWPALEFTVANMPNLTDIVLGGTEAYRTFALHGGVAAERGAALKREEAIIWRDGIRLHVTSHTGIRGVNSRMARSGLRGWAAASEDWERILRSARLGRWA